MDDMKGNLIKMTLYFNLVFKNPLLSCMCFSLEPGN